MLPRGACLILACLLLLAPAAHARAADASQPLPDEPGARFLNGSAFGAIVADLDGDGSRELVRLVSKADSPGLLAVDGWRVDGDAWHSIGEVGLTRAASVDEILSERPARRNPQRPVGVGEPARFLIWNDGQREHLLVATIAASLEPVACCLTVWDVSESGGRLTLDLLLSTQGNATSILSLDLDGDAAAELFISQQPDPRGPNEVPIRVYDWNGRSFDERIGSFIAPPGWAAFPSGDTDGRPGGEVLISSDPIDSGGDAVLNRIWLDGTSVESESWSVRDRGQVTSFDAGDGPLIAIVPPEIGLSLILRWPAGGPVQTEGGAAALGRLLGVFGQGAGARLLIAGAGGGSGLRVVDRGVRSVMAPPIQGAAVSFISDGLRPYTGELPGGLAGHPAFIANGLLLDEPATSARLEPLVTRPMAILPGITPIGQAGPAGTWMVLLYQQAFDPARSGGRLAQVLPFAGPVSVARTAQVLSPERDAGSLSAGFVGAVADDRGGLATRERSFTAQLSVPADAIILTSVGASPAQPGQAVGPSRDGAVTDTQVDVPAEAESGDTFSLRIGVVTAAGHGYLAQWRVSVLREPPPLAAETPIAPFSMDVTLTGATSPETTVTVDGRPVAVGSDGSFAASVAASLVPIDVHLVATDAVGNVTTRVISVVGFIDYRRLPWIPFVALLTVAVAVILFLKVPRPRLPAARAPDDDGRLEEID